MLSEYAAEENRQLLAMKAKIQSFIDTLPDNPNIRRVASNAFVMKSSELSKHDNWLPSFHDFKSQYAKVLDRLANASSISDFQNFIVRAIENRSIKVGKHTEKLNPQVVDELKSLI